MRYLLIFSPALLVLGIASCSAPGVQSPGGMVGQAASLPTLPNIEGGEVSLEDLFQNRSKGDPPNFLLLVNSHSKCDVTPKFLNALCEVWDDFEALKCHCACVVLEKEGAPAEVWKEYAKPDLLICRDPGGRCLDFYAKKQMPALTLVNRSGTMVFHCEGYLDPKTLAKKIKTGDFTEAKTTSG